MSERACACAWPGSQKKRHACSLTCGFAKVFTRKFYKMMAMLAETFVFLYMGMAMFSIEQVADSVAPAAAARSEPCPQPTDGLHPPSAASGAQHRNRTRLVGGQRLAVPNAAG